MDEKAIMILFIVATFSSELPAALLYNYAVSDISKAFVNDNAEAATKT